MKIKNIERLIRQTGIIEIVEGLENVWIGNGYVDAPLWDFRELSDEQAYSLFNVSGRDRGEKIEVTRRFPVQEEFRDDWPGEEPLRGELGRLIIGERELIVYASSCGAVYLRADHLQPFRKEDPDSTLFVRRLEMPDGMRDVPLVAVKSGVLLKGLISPVQRILTEEFAAALELLASETRLAIGDGGSPEPGQMTL